MQWTRDHDQALSATMTVVALSARSRADLEREVDRYFAARVRDRCLITNSER